MLNSFRILKLNNGCFKFCEHRMLRTSRTIIDYKTRKTLNKQEIQNTNFKIDEPLKLLNQNNRLTLTKLPTIQNHNNISSPLATFNPENSDAGDVTLNFVPTFNFAAYVNESETLKQLVKLGVDLSKIEKRKGLPEFVLKLDFETNIKPYLIFLTDNGVEPSNLGKIIEKNPLIFKEDLDNLQVRINYLYSKKFSKSQIERIITKNPYWLMFSTSRIDRRLGFFQTNFQLTGNEIRFLTMRAPRLITYNMEHIRKNIFCIKEEMGFDEDEIKCLILNKPKLLTISSNDLIERFHYVHKIMKITHESLIQFPEVLLTRLYRIKQRHEFLKMLGKAQYDPSHDLYTSLKQLVEGVDQDFVINVAKSDILTYDKFLKTL